MNRPVDTPAPAPLVTVDADHPWLGLAAFTEETQRFFFGRDAEIAEIFVRVRDNTLTILYGQSGLGKSSLLGAGLLPKLRVEDYRPVPIRLRYDETDPPLLDQVFAELEKAHLLGTNRPTTLWEWLHHRENRPQDFDTRPPVLVFDQFEEIFTLGQRAERLEETRALFTQLAELIENRSPAALRTRFQKDRHLARDYDNAPTPARLVITLREDFLSHLEQWKKILPSLMKNRMALDLLDGPQALEAVVRPGRMEGRHLVEEEVGAAIVRFVAKKGAQVPLEEIGAVPPLLSLVCDELNRLRLAQNLATITDGLVETQSSDILNNFYHDSFANLPDAVRHFIEDRLITEGGHRNPVAQEDALTAFRRAGVENPTAALDQLVARRLISPEERGGLLWIEITHDVLAPLVVRSRDERLERERAAEAERREMEARKARNKLRFLLSLFSILTLLAMAGAIYGFLSSREAQRQSAEATAQRDEARYNEGLGWMLRAQVAEERENQYPDTLLYAAQAIGFDGVGRPENAPENLLRLIRENRNPEAYQVARKWISERPAYLPIWSSSPMSSAATGLDISADGRYLALATKNGSVCIWDLREQTKSNIQEPKGISSSVAFNPFNDTLSYSSLETIKRRNIVDLREGGSLADSCNILSHSPDGRILLTANIANTITIWRDGKAVIINTGLKSSACGLVFSPDNSCAAASFSDGVRLIFPYYGTLAHAWLNHRESSSSVSISPEGDRLAVGDPEGYIVIYDTLSATTLGRCSKDQKHSGSVTDLTFRRDGKQLASVSADGTVRLWDVTGSIPTITATLRGHPGGVTKASWFPCGKLLATAGADGGVRIWNVSDKNPDLADLYKYLDNSWYRFDYLSKEVGWNLGEGVINIFPGSLLGLHRAKADVAPTLLKAGAWGGLPSHTPMPNALYEQASEAFNSGNIRTSFLRLAQMEHFKGNVEGIADIRKKISSLEPKEKPFKNMEGIDLIWCEPGSIEMGDYNSEDGRESRRAGRKVSFTKGYWLAKSPLNQGQWTSLMEVNPSSFKGLGQQAPVENVTWVDAIEYCKRLTDIERARGTIPLNYEYTLPTEAEWENAYRSIEPKTLDKSTSALEFNDMDGAILEWCLDASNSEDFDSAASGSKSKSDGIGGYRIARCGDIRNSFPSSDYKNSLGLRPALVFTSENNN